MRPESLADDEVGNAVAIDVAEARSVGCENVTPPAFFVERSSMMMCRSNEILPWRALLLEPRQPPSVRGKHRHDIIQLVAVHVVDRHHAATHAALVAAEACGW